MQTLFEHQSDMFTCAREICERVFGHSITSAHPRLPAVICDNQFLQLRAFHGLKHWPTARIHLAVTRVRTELIHASLIANGGI
jgi:hypothetical protein